MTWSAQNVAVGDRVTFRYRDRELVEGTVSIINPQGFAIIHGDNRRIVACDLLNLLPPKNQPKVVPTAPAIEQLALFVETGATA